MPKRILGCLLLFFFHVATVAVGGDTSWGRPVHAQYMIKAEQMHYSFILLPFDTQQQQATQLAGTRWFPSD